VFSDARRNPGMLEGLREADDGGLLEGSGAPEGRVDFPIFLQTVIRHRIRERFRTVQSRFAEYMGVEDARDFREHTVSEFGSIRGIEPIAEYGEYPRMRSTEAEGPPYSVGKHGGIYAVTFELVINDEMNQILNRIPRELGKSTAEYEAQAHIALVESNPTYIDGVAFFHASRGNLVTGAAAEPNETNLVAILDTLALKRDAENMPISVRPSKIVVRNPSTKFRFDQIIRSQLTGVRSEVTAAGAPDFAPGNYNPLYNVLPPDSVIEEPWLNDPNDWYLFADAQDRPAFVRAYLRGRRDPYIFLKDSGMRGLGGGTTDPYSMEFDEVPYKVRHVFGDAVAEPLAAVKAQP
jgi:hypothetical protein